MSHAEWIAARRTRRRRYLWCSVLGVLLAVAGAVLFEPDQNVNLLLIIPGAALWTVGWYGRRYDWRRSHRPRE